MNCFGSHVSVAGGLDRGIDRACKVGCDCIQIFTKNNNQWAAKPLEPTTVQAWKSAMASSPLRHAISHASYLINLAAPDDALFNKSIESMTDEMRRAMALGLEGVVVHPGAFTTSNEATGLQRVIVGLCRVLENLENAPETLEQGSCRILLENTAGQGSCLGHSLRHLETLFDGVAQVRGNSEGLGFCLDTCHAFAAGVDWRDAAAANDFKSQLLDRLPKNCLRALHLNDSKKPLGSRVDRHEHIGRGEIGEDGFRWFLNDPYFATIPGYLETEKGIDEATSEDWDVINLRALRQLVR